MSTPEQPETPQLTRKQLRDIRNTGSTPIIDMASMPVITADEVPGSAADDEAPVAPPPIEESLPAVSSLAPAAHLARAAEPVFLPEPPAPDLSVDLGVTPLTRRQARQQERIRTASVPVITPEISASYAAQALVAGSGTAPADSEPADEEEVPQQDDDFATLGIASGPIAQVGDSSSDVARADEHLVDAPDAEGEPDVESEVAVLEQIDERDGDAPGQADGSDIAGTSSDLDELVADAEPAQEVTRTVAPDFGAALLAGDGPTEADLPPTFDDLITRSASGSVATPNALILSQVPDGGSIVAPVNATGEVLITGSFNLPEGLGSTGHAVGTADGKEVDAVLVDGELPAHSSPTPIAALAAISTAKQHPGEIIKPPTPEKGGKLMLTLAITAGVLALALVGVLILAVTTGVF